MMPDRFSRSSKARFSTQAKSITSSMQEVDFFIFLFSNQPFDQPTLSSKTHNNRPS